MSHYVLNQSITKNKHTARHRKVTYNLIEITKGEMNVLGQYKPKISWSAIKVRRKTMSTLMNDVHGELTEIHEFLNDA